DGTVTQGTPNEPEPVAPPLPPQKPAPKPPTKGAATNLGQGVVQKLLHYPDMETIANTEALFEFVPLNVTVGNLFAIFFVFSDALMWEVPEEDAEWKFWKGTDVEQPFPQIPFNNPSRQINRRRLARLMCKGEEVQRVADKILVTQAQLLKRVPPV